MRQRICTYKIEASVAELFFLGGIAVGKQAARFSTNTGGAIRMQPANTEKDRCRTSITGSNTTESNKPQNIRIIRD
jgi:hypothetical protein